MFYCLISVLLMTCLLTSAGVDGATNRTKLKILVQELRDDFEEFKNQVASASGCSCRGSEDFIQEDDYILAFRLTAGIGNKGYDAFVDTDRDDDIPIMQASTPCTCRSNFTGCRTHYRSSIVKYWSRLPIEKVKLVVYAGGQARHFALFDGTGSTYKNWMSSSRLLDSSWLDLKTSKFNFFSVDGDGVLKRRFFMNQLYLFCTGDAGWLVVKDEADICPWGALSGINYPVILFSPSSSKVQYQSAAVGRADTLAVWVKVSGISDLNVDCQS